MRFFVDFVTFINFVILNINVTTGRQTKGVMPQQGF
jgi:hypothetical protein